jgi:hypothetical protein
MRKWIAPAVLALGLVAAGTAQAQKLTTLSASSGGLGGLPSFSSGSNLGGLPSFKVADTSNSPVTFAQMIPAHRFRLRDLFTMWHGVTTNRTPGRSFLPTGPNYMNSFGLSRPRPFGQ